MNRCLELIFPKSISLKRIFKKFILVFKKTIALAEVRSCYDFS